MGQHDFNGNRFATCRFKWGQGDAQAEITARTYPGDPKVLYPQNVQEMISDDGQAWIIGPDFTVQVLMAAGLDIRKAKPDVIASQVGGELT